MYATWRKENSYEIEICSDEARFKYPSPDLEPESRVSRVQKLLKRADIPFGVSRLQISNAS